MYLEKSGNPVFMARNRFCGGQKNVFISSRRYVHSSLEKIAQLLNVIKATLADINIWPGLGF
jgi:hypothetical protein